MNNHEQSQEDITKETEKKCLNDKCSDIGIYGLKNKITGKWYVGQSITSIKNRWDEYRRVQCYNQPKLINALRKYGYDAFEKVLLEECAADQSVLNDREDYWIKHYDSVENGYNCRYGGANGKFSKEAKLRVKQGCLNKVYTPELLEKLSAGGKRSKGKIVSEETKNRMSVAHRKNAMKNRDHMLKMNARSVELRKNKLIADEINRKISEASKGKIISESSREKISLAMKEHHQTHKHCWTDKSHTEESKEKMAMYIWITNGLESKRHIHTEPIPDGYKQGRLYKRKPIEP